MLLIRSEMSSTLHAVVRSVSFTGFGKRPVLTPFHHVDLLTGMYSNTVGSLRNPLCGILSGSIHAPYKQKCPTNTEVTVPHRAQKNQKRDLCHFLIPNEESCLQRRRI